MFFIFNIILFAVVLYLLYGDKRENNFPDLRKADENRKTRKGMKVSSNIQALKDSPKYKLHIEYFDGVNFYSGHIKISEFDRRGIKLLFDLERKETIQWTVVARWRKETHQNIMKELARVNRSSSPVLTYSIDKDDLPIEGCYCKS